MLSWCGYCSQKETIQRIFVTATIIADKTFQSKSLGTAALLGRYEQPADAESSQDSQEGVQAVGTVRGLRPFLLCVSISLIFFSFVSIQQVKVDKDRSFHIVNLQAMLRQLYANAATSAKLEEHPVDTQTALSSLRHGTKWRQDCKSIAVQVRDLTIFVNDFVEFVYDGRVGIGKVEEILVIETQARTKKE